MWLLMGRVSVGGRRPTSSRSNNRSFVYLSDKESGVRRDRESGVELSR